MEKINFYLEKTSLILIAFLPLGLLFGSGVSTTMEILITFFFLLISIINKNFFWLKNKYFYLLILIWLSLIINLLVSQNFSFSFYRNFFFFKNILFVFALMFFFKKKSNLHLIFFFYSIMVSVVSFDIIYEYINKKNILGFESNDPSRIVSFLKDELKIAHFMIGFLFITVGYYLENNIRRRSIYTFFIFFFFTIFFISILLTGERANSIRSFLILLMFIFFLREEILKYKKIYLVIIFFILFSSYFLSINIKHRFNIYLNSIQKIGFIKTFEESQHGAHYYTAFKIFEKYPIAGVGNKNFRNECSNKEYENLKYLKNNDRCSTHPHQIYLEFLSELGLIGTITIISILFYIILQSIKIYFINKNTIHLASILYVISQLLPFIPSGSFFTSWNSTIFWINFSILIFYNLKYYKNIY